MKRKTKVRKVFVAVPGPPGPMGPTGETGHFSAFAQVWFGIILTLLVVVLAVIASALLSK